MSWDFILPLCLGDLVKTGGINQYVVQDVVSPKHLPSSVNSKYEVDLVKSLRKDLSSNVFNFLHLEFKSALRSKGPLCILEHFDTGYSVLQWVFISMLIYRILLKVKKRNELFAVVVDTVTQWSWVLRRTLWNYWSKVRVLN